MRQLTDIEAINDEHNTVTHFPGYVEVDGNFGVAQYDGNIARVWLADTETRLALDTEDAMTLGAALLTITKDAGETNE